VCGKECGGMAKNGKHRKIMVLIKVGRKCTFSLFSLLDRIINNNLDWNLR